MQDDCPLPRPDLPGGLRRPGEVNGKLRRGVVQATSTSAQRVLCPLP